MTQTNSQIREEWKEELKPKVTIFSEEYNDIKDVALTILNEYWNKLEPKIDSLLKTQREEERQFILNILDGIDKADEEMGNNSGGTKAIRLALQSRV